MATLKDSNEMRMSNDEMMLEELERRDGIYSFIFHELESPHSLQTANAANETESSNKQRQLHLLDGEVVNKRKVKREGVNFITPPSARTWPHHEFLKAWHPPANFAYDHPKFYNYMANCGFRVRMSTPRFSHVTAPLVRNRRHILKESAEYKSWEMGISKTPDLRLLFPHDPDVHVPFRHRDACAEYSLGSDIKEENY